MKISVITICYNNLEGLKLTAQSIESQTSQDFEWVVIDGASTDGTISYLNGLKRKPDVLVSEPDNGIYDAMNKGMNAAHGEYQLYLNSGDYFYNENIISKAINMTFNADIVYGDLEFVFPQHRGIGYYPHEINVFFLLYSALGHPASFIKAQRLKEIGGYDSRFRIVSDWKIWFDFFLKGFTFQHCDFCVSSFVTGGISSTSNDIIIEERTAILKELFSSKDNMSLIPKVNLIIPYPYESPEAKEIIINIEKQYYPNVAIISFSDKNSPSTPAKYTLTISKEDSANSEYIARKIESYEYAPKANCVVGIPVYKQSISDNEKKSLKQCFTILKNQDIVLIAPESLDISSYEEAIGNSIKTIRFEDRYFRDIEGYNNLMLSHNFYLKFDKYKYLLIYQLDAWVFQDTLQYWCEQNYDYIGAPWFDECKSHEQGCKLWAVGNGGLSLRKIEGFLTFTSPKTKVAKKVRLFGHTSKILSLLGWYIHRNKSNAASYIKTATKRGWNEDGIFSFVSDWALISLKRPSPKEASLFSIEKSPSYLFKENEYILPFGCHAWEKFEYKTFWKYYIG